MKTVLSTALSVCCVLLCLATVNADKTDVQVLPAAPTPLAPEFWSTFGEAELGELRVAVRPVECVVDEAGVCANVVVTNTGSAGADFDLMVAFQTVDRSNMMARMGPMPNVIEQAAVQGTVGAGGTFATTIHFEPYVATTPMASVQFAVQQGAEPSPWGGWVVAEHYGSGVGEVLDFALN